MHLYAIFRSHMITTPFSNKSVNMYFDRVVNYWNTLPKDYIVNSRTVNKFKFLIRNINFNACIEDTR